MRLNLGVGQRLVAGLAVLLVILVSIFLVDVHLGTKSMALSIVKKTLGQNTRSVTATLDGWIEDKVLFLQLAASEQSVITAAADGDWEKATQWLLKAKGRDSMLESLFVHDAKGNSVVTTNTGGRGKNYSSRPYYKAIIGKGHDSYISNVTLSPASKKPRIALVQAIKKDGRTIGYIGMSVLAEAFTAYLSPIKVGERGYCYMFDSTGTILSHPNKDLIFKDLSKYEFI